MSLKESIKRMPLALRTWRWLYGRAWFRGLVDDLLILRLYGRLRPKKLRLPGSNHTMYVNPRENRARAILKCRASGQGPTKELWRRAVEALEPSIVLDVGLNYGEIVLSQRYDAKARIIGIEANPLLMPYLERSRVEHPNARQIEFHCALASDQSDSTSTFFINRRWSGSSSAILDATRPGVERCEVQSLAIDSLFAGHDLSDQRLLFKIDVEGYEPLVLRGMQRLLRECECWVGIIEFNTAFLAKVGENVDEYLQTLADRAQVYSVDRHGKTASVDPANARQSLEQTPGQREIEVDLLLISRQAGPELVAQMIGPGGCV